MSASDFHRMEERYALQIESEIPGCPPDPTIGCFVEDRKRSIYKMKKVRRLFRNKLLWRLFAFRLYCATHSYQARIIMPGSPFLCKFFKACAQARCDNHEMYKD